MGTWKKLSTRLLESVVSPLLIIHQKMFGLGELPKEYNPKVHGPYDPSVYYGPNKALGNVKLTELPGWLARRNMYSPTGMARAMSRTYWRWNFKYMLPKYAGATGALQLTASACVFFYVINCTKYWDHKNFKHQW